MWGCGIGCVGGGGGGGPVLLPLGGRLPLGRLDSQLPCLLLHSPPLLLLLSNWGLRSLLVGQRATSQGAPPQVPSPGLCSPRQMPGTTWPHGLQAARCPGHQRKAFPRPNHPAPLSPKAQRRRQAPAPRRRRCHSPGGLSPEEQARAEVRVL